MGLSELLYESAYPMNENLTAIRQRAEAALIGPWENDELLEISGPGAVAVAQVRGPDDFPCLDEDADIDALQQEAEATAAFIAHARQDIPDLLDRIEALERALVTARTAIEQVEYVDLTADWSYCPWCNVRKGAQPYGNTSGHLFCKRQQALTEIIGVGITGAEAAAATGKEAGL